MNVQYTRPYATVIAGGVKLCQSLVSQDFNSLNANKALGKGHGESGKGHGESGKRHGESGKRHGESGKGHGDSCQCDWREACQAANQF